MNLSPQRLSSAVPSSSREMETMEKRTASKPQALSMAERALKRGFDLVFASMLLVMAAPLMMVIALAIKCDSWGAVFFFQQRSGRGGRSFSICKFRTMREHNTPHHKLDFVKPGDPRITKLGRFLRNTSLDELPQLLNVLKGEMSMVGPRPQPVCHLEHYGAQIPGYRRRLLVKPGITGLVQVSDMRSLVDTLDAQSKRAQLDLEYIDNWSVWNDIRICWKTAATMVLRYNVHMQEFPEAKVTPISKRQ